MHRLSAHNALAWVGGVAGVVAIVGLQFGLLHNAVGAVVLVAGLVAGAYFLFAKVRAHRHSQEVRAFAQQHGWEYAAHPPGITTSLSGFPLGVGSNRRVDDCIAGTYGGVPCTHFTYRFEHSFGDDKAVEQAFTLTVGTLDVRVATLDLIPEGAASRVLGAISGADIDLESAEFNRTWKLRSEDKRFAVDVVDPRMMEHLLRHRLPGVAVRIDRDYVIAWSAGIAPLDDLASRLNLVTGIASRIPAHVVRSFAERDRERREEEAARLAAAPTWANQPGVLNSRRYTGIDVSDDDAHGERHWWSRR